MDSAGALSPEELEVAVDYLRAADRLLTKNMTAKEMKRDRGCRHIWQLIHGISTFHGGRGGKNMTGPALRNFGQKRFEQKLQKDERCPRTDLILGVLHLLGVLVEDSDKETIIHFTRDHKLVLACLKYT